MERVDARRCGGRRLLGAGCMPVAMLAVSTAVSCARPAPAPPVAPPPSGPATESPPAQPAFVVYTLDERTVVIPLSEPTAARTLDGLWIPTVDGAVRYGAVPEAEEGDDAPILRPCADAFDVCDGYGPLLVEVSADRTDIRLYSPDERSVCDCIYVASVSDDYEGWLEDEDEDEDCGEPEGGTIVRSVQGGHIYLTKWAYDDCEGDTTTVEGSMIVASPAYPVRPMSAPRASTCSDAGNGGFDNDYETPLDQCEAEIEYPWLVDGQRAMLAVSNSDNGVKSCCARVESLSAMNCPSPIDPCGMAMDSDGVGTDDYWVATDDAATLIRRVDTLEIVDRGRSLRSKVELDRTVQIVGVHYVRHAAGYGAATRTAVAWDWGPLPQPAQIAGLETLADYGDRARAQLEAGELDAAEAIAWAGLFAEQDRQPAARGSILFTLGQVAEARGRTDDARSYYRRSLDVRPGDTATQARLDAL